MRNRKEDYEHIASCDNAPVYILGRNVPLAFCNMGKVMLDTLGWDVGDLLHTSLLNRYDRFFVIEGSDTACVIYGGFEPHAFVMVGPLAIFRRRDHPELVLNATEMECVLSIPDPIRWNRVGTILFVTVNIEWQKLRRVAYPLAVIDLVQGQFSFITGRELSAHTITEIDERKYRLTEKDLGRPRNHYDPPAFTVDLDSLPWYGFDQIDSFSSLYKVEHERRGLLQDADA